MTATLEGLSGQQHPGRTLSPGKTQYPFYMRLGGPQCRSGRAEDTVPTRIRSRTLQPIAQSLYRLSYPAHFFIFHKFKCMNWCHKLAIETFLYLLTVICISAISDSALSLFYRYSTLTVSLPLSFYS